MTINLLIIGFTALISFLAFNNQEVFYKLQHWPYVEARRGEYFRWLTGGFLHANPLHLIFNLLTLYFFGQYVESWFRITFPDSGALLYLVFYLLAIPAASIATYFKYRDFQGFASVGASGAVAAVLFCSIVIDPTIGIYLFFIPIPIPGFIFGPLYLWYSAYSARQNNDHIDHLAHFYGAVFGLIFPMLFQPSLFQEFLLKIRLYLM